MSSSLSQPAPRSGARGGSRLARLRRALPRGRTLPDEVWTRRHRWLLTILWVHVPVLFAYGVLRGVPLWEVLGEVGLISAFAALASVPNRSRRFRAGVVSIGMLTASSVLVHFAGGAIEAHFDFFLQISLLTLYEDWTPFMLAIGYVILHHGILGVWRPRDVYSHASAWQHPWKWAAIHAGFVTAVGLANIAAWRLNEDVRADAADSLARARASERRFRTAFDDAPIGMAITGLDGRWLDVNPALCELLGRSQAWLLEHGFPDVTHPDDVSRDVDQMHALIGGDVRRYTSEQRYVHADGRLIWVALSVALVRDDHGRPLHFISHMQDVTERHRQAEQLERRAADLERSNQDLEQFAYVASHDLSEPLRTVAGFVRLLGERYRGRLDEDADTFIDFAVGGTERMQRLIEDLLRYSRAGRPDVELGAVELGEVARATVAGLEEAIREAGGSVEIGALPRVEGDPGQLGQLLQNLIVNGLKFRRADAPPHLRVGAEPAGERWAITVEDDGIGVAPAHAERIFGMFKRLHDRDAYPGTGIGLAIAKKIVDRHGGQIWHEPAPSGGSRFCFTLAPTGAPASSVTACARSTRPAGRPSRPSRPGPEARRS